MLVEFPDFVKQADLASVEDSVAWPSGTFADPRNRRYPIQTEADTWLSCRYFDKFAAGYREHEYNAINDNLVGACELWGIPREASEIPQHQEKEASTSVVVQYVLDDEVQHTSEVHGPEELLKVASDLLENKDKYPWEMRRGVGRQVLHHAQTFGIQFDQSTERDLQKTAGYGVATLHDVMSTLHNRATIHRMDNQEFVTRLISVKQDIQKTARQDLVPPETLDKVAGLLDVMDRMADLHHKWGSENFTAPEDRLYHITRRDLGNFRDGVVVLQNGRFVSKQAAVGANIRVFMSDYLGDDLQSDDEAFEKLAELAPAQCTAVADYIQEFSG
jgi:hypothetical protein